MNEPIMRRDAGQTIRWTKTGPAPGMPHCDRYVSPDSNCQVFVTDKEPGGWHLSISHPWRDPLWAEIASARYALIPDDVRMVMHLPPAAEYVNIHTHCFHLHQCACA